MSLLQNLFASVSDVDAAQTEVDAARDRLATTIEDIHARIRPSNLMDEAIAEVKARSSDLAQSAGKMASERPATVVAGATAIGLLLAHKPLTRLARKLFAKHKETPPVRRSSGNRKKSQPAPVRIGP